jgi:hypothetical protein
MWKQMSEFCCLIDTFNNGEFEESARILLSIDVSLAVLYLYTEKTQFSFFIDNHKQANGILTQIVSEH